MNTQVHATKNHAAMPDRTGEAPKANNGLPWLGHLIPFLKHPYELMQDLAQTHGEIVSFHLLSQEVVLLTGAEASELFYLSDERQVDQSPYRNILEPIYGDGVLFATTNGRKNEQLRVITPALRMEALHRHTQTIAMEIDAAISHMGESGEIDAMEFMDHLTINTSSHCLFGNEFRHEFCNEFERNYQEIVLGLTPLAHVFPHLPIPTFRRRDRARLRLQAMVKSVIEKRGKQEEKPSDLLQHLLNSRYMDGRKFTVNEITGLLIAVFMAGHHTTAGTVAWTLIELLRHPKDLKKIHEELDLLLEDHHEASFEVLRNMHHLENVVKETLRLHPPLFMIMRKALQDLRFKQYTIKAGTLLLSSPPITHRLAKHFPDPLTFNPDRYEPSCKQDRTLAYQPFGGGKHKCRGNVFASMHVKAIFAKLLRQYSFELMDAPETYADNYKGGIGLPHTPCPIRYRRRSLPEPATRTYQNATLQAEANMLRCPMTDGAHGVSSEHHSGTHCSRSS